MVKDGRFRSSRNFPDGVFRCCYDFVREGWALVQLCPMSTLTFSLTTLNFSSVRSVVPIFTMTTFSFDLSALDFFFVLFFILLLLMESFPETLLGPMLWIFSMECPYCPCFFYTDSVAGRQQMQEGPQLFLLKVFVQRWQLFLGQSSKSR